MYYIILYGKYLFHYALKYFIQKHILCSIVGFFAMLANYPKISMSNNLKGEEIYFGSKFQRSQSVVTWLHYCVSVIRPRKEEE